jgi:hypothetical protein
MKNGYMRLLVLVIAVVLIAMPLEAAIRDPNGPGLPQWPAFNRYSAVTMELGDSNGPLPVARTAAKFEFFKQVVSTPAPSQSKPAAVQPGRFDPPKPGLEFMARFEVNLDAPVLEVGQVEGLGNRRVVPITGGKFEGPRLKGQILNNGADWQLAQGDGLTRLDTRYALRTDDGALIYIQTRGFRYGPANVLAEVLKGNSVDPNRYYFRVYIQFETGDPRYAWLNRAMAIGSAMRLRNAVIYDAYLIK